MPMAQDEKAENRKKSIRILDKKKPKRKGNSLAVYAQNATPEVDPVQEEEQLKRDLQTCVPFHVGSTGAVVNDEVDDDVCPPPNYDDYDNDDENGGGGNDPYDRLPLSDSLPSARAPSGPNLSLISSDPWEECQAMRPLLREHDLTLSEIQAGLSGMERSGYSFNYSTLNLSNRGLLDISLLEYFSELQHLDISGNYINCVQLLGGMPYLKTVNAARNEIGVFGDFRAPVSLQKVNFSRNRITEIVNLETFWALTDVNLSHNEIIFAEGFEQCKHLRVLDLSHNRISTIENLRCPKLLVLILHNNEIEEIMNLDGCPSLRALSLAQNKIQSLAPLHNMTQLTELWLQNNQIGDLAELDHIKSLSHLYALCLNPNPLCTLGLWRRMLIFVLPRLRYLDGKFIEPMEHIKAKNTFDPSYWKVAHETRVSIILDHACQAGNTVMDNNVHKNVVPSIILLVGAPLARSNKLAVMLKEKYRSKIQLGGVHSTATTLEFPNTNKDIPVSYETFVKMKYRGEFLATSHVLGRICGFATSQITRATERSAVLIACVPLVVAITLVKWKLRPRIVLVMPTDKVDVTQLGKVASDALLKEEDFAAAEALLKGEKLSGDSDPGDAATVDPRNSIASGSRAGDYRADSISPEEKSRHSVPAVSFVPGKTTYDLGARGSKKPSLVPYEGHGLLKNKDEEPDNPEIPELLRKSINRYQPGPGGQGSTENVEPSEDKTKPETTDKERNSTQVVQRTKTGLETESSSSRGPVHGGPDGQLENFNYVGNSSDDTIYSANIRTQIQSGVPALVSMEDHRTQRHSSVDSISSDFIQYFTDQENPTPFVVTREMHRLRRIASLFLEVGGANLSDILMNFPTLLFQPHLINSMDWKKTLLDLQDDDLNDLNHAYYMTFKRQAPGGKQTTYDWRQQMAICGSMAQPTTARGVNKNCTVTISREGQYQCLLSKNGESSKNTTTDGGFSAQASISVTDQPGAPTKYRYSESKTDPNSRANPDLAENNKWEMPPKCTKVFNPDFAFGPREHCCNVRIRTKSTASPRFVSRRSSRSSTSKDLPFFSSLNKQTTCCPVPDLNRGVFYDGKFRSNFLATRSSSEALKRSRATLGFIPADIQAKAEQGAVQENGSDNGKNKEETPSRLSEVTGPPRDPLLNKRDGYRPMACKARGDAGQKAATAMEQGDLQQFSPGPEAGVSADDHINPDPFEEQYETEDEEGELGGEDGSRRYSTAPPPSRDSSTPREKSERGSGEEELEQEQEQEQQEQEVEEQEYNDGFIERERSDEVDGEMDETPSYENGMLDSPGTEAEVKVASFSPIPSIGDGEDRDMDEAENSAMENEANNDVYGPSRRKRHEVTEACILNTRQQYARFNRDNPGFFDMVIDSSDLDTCLAALVELFEECQRNQKISRNDNGSKPITYAHTNVLDGPKFLNHRLEEYKRISREFSKGSLNSQCPKFKVAPKSAGQSGHKMAMASHSNMLSNNLGSSAKTTGINLCSSPLYFEETKCPENLLEPFIARKQRNAKMRKLAQY